MNNIGRLANPRITKMMDVQSANGEVVTKMEYYGPDFKKEVGGVILNHIEIYPEPKEIIDRKLVELAHKLGEQLMDSGMVRIYAEPGAGGTLQQFTIHMEATILQPGPMDPDQIEKNAIVAYDLTKLIKK